MRRFLTLVCLLCVALPAGVSITGCFRNPQANYCNGLGYGLKVTDPATIFLSPQTTGISLAFGQTQQIASPTAKTCKGAAAGVSGYTYGTTNNQLVDISPSGNICAGTWNRNIGGGINPYTICNFPNPLPATAAGNASLPYGIAYITASANSITSNPVEVYIHPQVTSVALAGPNSCLSQGTLWPNPLDVQACFTGSNNTQQVLCAPPLVTGSVHPVWACAAGPPPGVSAASIPDCSAALGTLNYNLGNATVASINVQTNQITAQMPGTTIITASIAGGASTAGYFSTCPPASISLALANGGTSGTITQGVTQNLTTKIVDTQGQPITGLTLDYQSTDPIDISVGGSGSISTNFPGVASVSAICQPATCNPAPINVTGVYGTGLSITSNPVKITVPGTASAYAWFASPGQSQYFVPLNLLSGQVGSTVRLPFVPNSMVMDRNGINLYFGSLHELMYYNANSNTMSRQDTAAPGVVLAVSPNNGQLLINDQIREVFYLYAVNGGSSSIFGGMGTAAQWTPDSKTLYITDSAAQNLLPEVIAAGTNHHTDTLYVYNVNTGWTSYPLACSVYNAASCPNPSTGAQSVAVTIPGVGAYMSGNPTVAHTWCPSGTVGDTNSMVFYPQGDSVSVQTDVLTATTDGQHILGAALNGGAIALEDIGVQIPVAECSSTTTGTPPNEVQTLEALTIEHSVNSVAIDGVTATQVNQVVASPNSTVAFITYDGETPGAQLPYYIPGSGTVSYVTLSGGSAVTAPLAATFTPDGTLLFVGTAGDNMVHYIAIPKAVTAATPPTDTQQIAPSLPACTPVSAGGNDLGCTYTGTDTVVPVTAIGVKPRSTT